MRLRRAAVGTALVAMVVLAGCDWGRGQDGGGGRAAADNATEAQVAPAADQEGSERAAAPGKAGSTEAAAQVRLVDLGNRIVRTATVDLEVDKGQLNETINRASDAVVKAKGIYVGSSTSVPRTAPLALFVLVALVVIIYLATSR